MAHYAKVENGIVTNVIVAEQDFIDSGAVGDPASWIQTSYNGTIRGYYAGIGYEYHADIDAFIPPCPFPSWILDKEKAMYVAPIPRPEGNYIWNEENQSWIDAPNILPGV